MTGLTSFSKAVRKNYYLWRFDYGQRLVPSNVDTLHTPVALGGISVQLRVTSRKLRDYPVDSPTPNGNAITRTTRSRLRLYGIPRLMNRYLPPWDFRPNKCKHKCVCTCKGTMLISNFSSSHQNYFSNTITWNVSWLKSVGQLNLVQFSNWIFKISTQVGCHRINNNISL